MYFLGLYLTGNVGEGFVNQGRGSLRGTCLGSILPEHKVNILQTRRGWEVAAPSLVGGHH